MFGETHITRDKLSNMDQGRQNLSERNLNCGIMESSSRKIFHPSWGKLKWQKAEICHKNILASV